MLWLKCSRVLLLRPLLIRQSPRLLQSLLLLPRGRLLLRLLRREAPLLQSLFQLLLLLLVPLLQMFPQLQPRLKSPLLLLQFTP